jgi:spore germination cell wall hydrolase CwlJ-like protein
MAAETLLDFLRRPPADDGERQAQDRAALALVDQAQRLGDAVRARLGVADGEQPTGLADHPPSLTPSGSVSLDRGSDNPRADNSCDPARALAATLWGEAPGEPFEGKIAIACVVRNRANAPGWWGRDVVGVCTAPAQFTCWHDGQAQRVRHVDETDASFAQCLDIARDVLAGQYRDHTGGADHYHVASMDPPPPWARGRKPTARIGAHLF